MSQPSREECIADGYEIARENCIERLDRAPTRDELNEEFNALCEKYSNQCD
jgi:hypothetical protein